MRLTGKGFWIVASCVAALGCFGIFVVVALSAHTHSARSLTVAGYRVVGDRLVAILTLTNGSETIRYANDKFSVAWEIRPSTVTRPADGARTADLRPGDYLRRASRPKTRGEDARLVVTNISRSIIGAGDTASAEVWLPRRAGRWQVRLRFYQRRVADYVPKLFRPYLPARLVKTNRVEFATGFVDLTEDMLPVERSWRLPPSPDERATSL